MTAEVSQIPPTISTVGHRLHLKKEEPAKRKNEMLENNNQGDEYDISRILEKEAEVVTTNYCLNLYVINNLTFKYFSKKLEIG